MSFFLLSCANFFGELSDKTTDKARLYDAKRFLDQSKWTEAIEKINLLSPEYQARRDVRALLASAYAGRCGIDMLNLINAINTGGSSEKLFVTLLKTMTNASVTTIGDCMLAETTLKLIGNETVRTVDENLLMTFIEFGKIGAILNFRADIDDDNLFDSAAGDAGFDACDNADIPQNDTVTDYASMSQLVVSISNLVLSLSASGSSIAGASLTALVALCSQGGTNVCNITDTSAVGDNERKVMRAIINANEVGLTVVNDTTDNVVLTCAGT